MWVPHELPAPYNERLPRHVRQPELKPQVAEMHGVHARAQHRDDGRQPAVHVEAGGPSPADGKRVEEERVDCQRHPTREEEGAVPPLHALAAGVEDMAEGASGAAAGEALFEVGTGLDGD